MSFFYVAVGLVVGVVVAGVLPWLLLRKLSGEKDAAGPGPSEDD